MSIYGLLGQINEYVQQIMILIEVKISGRLSLLLFSLIDDNMLMMLIRSPSAKLINVLFVKIKQIIKIQLLFVNINETKYEKEN